MDESLLGNNAATDSPDDPSSCGMQWYVLKIQSNREKSIKEALERSIRRDGMQE